MLYYDGPSAVNDHFKSELGMSNTKFTMLFSVVAWPSIIMSVVGGILVDRVFGLQNGVFIYGAIMAIGQIIFALGGTLNVFWTMLLGRFIYGIAIDSLSAAQSKYIVHWFKDKELNMAFSLSLAFNRLETMLCFLSMEPIYQKVKNSVRTSHAIGCALFIFSFACVISLCCSATLSKKNPIFRGSK
jgi:MFS family permease